MIHTLLSPYIQSSQKVQVCMTKPTIHLNHNEQQKRQMSGGGGGGGGGGNAKIVMLS